MVKKTTALLLGINIVVTPMCHADSFCDESPGDHLTDVVVVAGGVIGGILTGIGLYKVGRWLFSKDDQQIIQSAVQRYNSAVSRYQKMLEILDSAYRGGRSVHSVQEHVLYELGSAKVQEEYIDDYIYKLERTIKGLRSEFNTVNKRIHNLQSQAIQDSQAYQAKREMEVISDRINRLMPRLEFLHEFLRHHKSYFVLFELESDLQGTYDREVQAMNMYDYYNRTHEIRATIMNKYAAAGYPYLAYSRQITNDINRLNRTINKLSYIYNERSNTARHMLSILNGIKEIVITDSQYQHDIQAYNYDLRERKRIEAEQRKAYAMERQAYAQERQVRELQKQNRMLARQADTYYDDGCSSITIQVNG